MKYLSEWRVYGRPGMFPVFFLLVCLQIQAQEFGYNSRSDGLGGCYGTVSPAGCLLYNEALLGRQDHWQFAFQHGRPYITKALGVSSLSLQAPVFSGTFSFSSGQVGIPGFRQFSQHMGYGMQLSEALVAGIGFRYHTLSTAENRNYLWQAGISGGIYYIMGELTSIGVHFLDPLTINNYPRYGKNRTALFTVSMYRMVYENTSWYLESEIQSGYGMRFKTAIEIDVQKQLQIRSGYHTLPHTFTFGTGIRWSGFTLDTGMAWSLSRGISPSLQITYQPSP